MVLPRFERMHGLGKAKKKDDVSRREMFMTVVITIKGDKATEKETLMEDGKKREERER